ncbi:MAG: J domain-containing protein [Myxococcales bacterium]|nr:MAG: J domain-containing protein [Myxococcales bacterium]
MLRSTVDYYELLGIERVATLEEVKRAYRKQAARLHPDRNPDDPGAGEAFRLCVEAYRVLSDPDKRKQYDRLGPIAFDRKQISQSIDFNEVVDSLRDLFRQKRESSLPKDIEMDVEISLPEAAFGVSKNITVDRQTRCNSCSGTGAAKGSSAEPCIACKSRGVIKGGKGFFAKEIDCPRCEGKGRIVESPCKSCAGKGFRPSSEVLTVSFPAGIEDGKTRSIRGAGDQSRAGDGDLHLRVRIAKHPLFKRKGADVHCTLVVSFSQCTLGDELDVPTLDGKVTMKLPAGTPSGKVFRLRGKGFPVLGGLGRGDQYVTVTIDVPKKLTKKQKELVRQLAIALPEPKLKESLS